MDVILSSPRPAIADPQITPITQAPDSPTLNRLVGTGVVWEELIAVDEHASWAA
jgi:hypothetical protein